MIIEQMKPGQRVEAREPLGYGVGGDHGRQSEIRYHEVGAKGTIVNVGIDPEYPVCVCVKVQFDGVEQPYRCDPACARFAFRAVAA